LTNNGNGSFSVQNPGTIGSGSLINASLGDINGDGVLDLISTFGGEVRINLQNTTQVSTQSLLDLKTQEQARSALTYLKSELRRITSELGAIGSHQSRIGVATKVLQVARDNYILAESRIMDIDMAEELANSVRLRILQQVGATILAQGNLQPQIALKLISTPKNRSSDNLT
jgi:flagellin-like hook-associated protein FlgL